MYYSLNIPIILEFYCKCCTSTKVTVQVDQADCFQRILFLTDNINWTQTYEAENSFGSNQIPQLEMRKFLTKKLIFIVLVTLWIKIVHWFKKTIDDRI